MELLGHNELIGALWSLNLPDQGYHVPSWHTTHCGSPQGGVHVPWASHNSVIYAEPIECQVLKIWSGSPFTNMD